ncbi:anoctamin-10 [Garra rufa]|uniref:anoctamin-10 n=1 Tax=Garra rufa TaxID=137080 RepID=UPI003CCECB9A
MTSQKEPQEGLSTPAKVTGPSSWSRVSCPCCISSRIEPLVLIQLAENVQPITKQWIMSVISAPVKAGGAQLLVHPGEDMKGDMIVVAAPRCTLLRVTEDLGLCKTYQDENMTAFSFEDRDNFCNIDNMQQFLTLAERQFIVKHELDSMRAREDQRIPGVQAPKGKLKSRESILQKLEKAGVIRNITPLHDHKLLSVLGKQWYSHKSLWGQPLENHREESSFDYHHTTKVLVFTFFNNFAVLFHIAFFKEDLPLLRKRLSSLLIVTQLVNQFTEVVVPFLVDHFLTSADRNLKEDDPEVDHLQAQGSLPTFPGLFAEYIELLVQFGYLSLFSCVYPLTAPLLLLNNLTEIRTDAYKLCKLFNKPFSAPVANMGVWQVAFEVLSFISVMSNCWLLLLSPRVKDLTEDASLSSSQVLVIAVIVEHVLIMVKMILALMIPDEPDWVRIKREQIEYHSMQALKKQRITCSRVDDKLPLKA